MSSSWRAITQVWQHVRGAIASRNWHSMRPSQRQLALAAFALGVFILRAFWLPPAGAYLIESDPLSQTADALVPLAGDRERIGFAARLYAAGWARELIVTDTYYSEGRLSYAEAMRRLLISADVPAGNIHIAPGQASSTYAEAQNIRALAQGNGWNSIIVVTSPYHTHRARLVFADVFSGSGISITVRAVEPSWYTAASWWFTAAGRTATVQEYFKLLLRFAGYNGAKSDTISYQNATKER